MACLARNLSVLAYANGFTLWHYRTGEPLAAVLAPELFDWKAGAVVVVTQGPARGHTIQDEGECGWCRREGGWVGAQ